MKSLLSFDAYTLKWIAVIGMITNHVAYGFASLLPLPLLLFLYALGGLTYVIMAFFVVEGYKHTSSLPKYFRRLFIFGLIAQAFHPMVFGTTETAGIGLPLNIMFTIMLSLLVLMMYDKIKIRFLFWLLFLVACGVALFMDLVFVGVLVPVMYYAIKKESRRRTLPGIVSGIIWGVLGLLAGLSSIIYLAGGDIDITYLVDKGMTPELMAVTPIFAVGCFLGAILIRNYNGSRGKSAKWLFYVMYPLHLAVIAIIAVAAGITPFSLFGFF